MISEDVIRNFCDENGYDFETVEPGFTPSIGFDLDKNNPGQGVADFIEYLYDNNCNIKEYLNEMSVEPDTVYFILSKDYYGY